MPAPNALKTVVARVDARLRRAYGVPRRRERDPVAQLVGTILSQATTDVQTDRSLAELRRRFPTWEQVRDAPSAAVARAIFSSGLSRQKAPRIKQALRHIARERGRIELAFLKTMPVEDARDWLMRMAGVGPKTASIVLLFSFNKPIFPVDTHVHRVTQRLGWIPPTATPEKAHRILEPLIPPGAHYRLHVNLVRHGRAVCQARRPRCEMCVLTGVCAYFQTITIKNDEISE